MLCRRPIHVQGSQKPVGCGQCIQCRINKRREWTGRIILEMLCNPVNLFITLTYAPAHLPQDGSLVPRDLKLFLMALNSAAGTFRYYAVGEYGDESQRPHYHVALFAGSHFDISKISQKWSKGFVSVSYLTTQRAAYTAAYVVKKLTKEGDSRLNGRHPEFARMSRRSGLGFNFVERLALSYETRAGAAFLAENGDIVPTFKYEGKNYPLGKFLTERLRVRLGIPLSEVDRRAANPAGHFKRELSRELRAIQEDSLSGSIKEWTKRKSGFVKAYTV